MSTSRRRLAALATAVVLASVTAACDPLDAAPSFTDELEVGAGDGAADRVTLDDGTELAVGADGGEDADAFIAQWRAPGADGWSAPQTMVEASGLDGVGVVLAADGGTAVVRLNWYAEGDDERETYARRDAVVCRDLVCDTVVEGVAGSPMLGADGEVAAVAMPDPEDDEFDGSEESDEDGDDVAAPAPELATWQLGEEEWRTVRLDGPPQVQDAYLRPDVVMVDDGSLATVHGAEGASGCRFELWVAAPRQTRLEPTHATDPIGSRGCTPEWVQADGDAVVFYSRSTDQEVRFEPTADGEGWSDDLPESGVLGFDGDEGRRGISMYLTRLEDGSSVAVGSPDGRRVVTQHRPAGATEWTRPRTVARAEAGQRCRMTEPVTLFDRTDVVYLVSCWPTDSDFGDEYSGAPPPTTGIALGSRDGRAWSTAPLQRPAYAPSAQVATPLLLARGGDRSLVWRFGATDFEEIALPLPHPTVDGLAVVGREAIRVTGNPDDTTQCRPRWDVAPLDATTWSYGGPIRPIRDYARGPGDCYGAVSDEEENGRIEQRGRLVRVVGVIESISSTIDGQLVRRGETWRFKPSPE